MKIKTERGKVVGHLHTQFGKFPMLAGSRVRWDAMNACYVAHAVIDAEGFQTQIAFNGEYLVLPDPFQPDVEVKLIVPDDMAVPFDDGAKSEEAVELKPDDEVFDGKTHIVGYDYQI